VQPATPRTPYAEYLAAERASEIKHEWLDGEVFAMAGGTPEHSGLAAAITAELRDALRGRPCRVFSSDLRVRVPETGLATYPDATVVCGRLETHPEDEHAVTNPVVLVEVLSDSTEGYDRGKKFAHYRRLASLRDYVLVNPNEARIEVFHRTDAGTWELAEAGAGQTIEIASLGCTLAVDEVYRDPLAPAPGAAPAGS
jgi:Uma2 family endonuclease